MTAPPPDAPLTDEQIDEALKLCDAASLAWERLDAACAGLLASQCRFHRPYMGCPLDCNDVEKALDPEHAEARQSVSPALALLPQALRELKAARAALAKISAIRDSIVGMQGFDFSEHAYPLVAALKDAGYEGAGYEISRANLGTLIDQRDAAQAERDALRQQLEAVARERDEARAVLSHLRATTVRQVENETAEAIASWLAASRADDDFDPDVRTIAARVRAGAWRSK